MKKHIGEKLRLLRAEKGLTQINIAESVFVSESTYRRIESGEGCLDIELLQKIVYIFDIELHSFFLEIENRL